MKKNYEVTIKAWRTVVVMQAESEDQAIEIAHDTTPMYAWEHDESTAVVVDDAELDSSRRHANETVEE